MPNNNPNAVCVSYFTEQLTPTHKRFLALHDFFAEGFTAAQVAAKHGYTISTVYAMARDFKKTLSTESEDPFFKIAKPGRKPVEREGDVAETVVSLRKKNYSVPDIQVALDAIGKKLTIYAIEKILTDAGFARLPRRDKQERRVAAASGATKLTAPKSCRINMVPDMFSSSMAGLLAIIPTIRRYGIDALIQQSPYPETREINRVSAILAFVALKLSNVKRYSADDIWCMDRGMGLFAGLNVLPKAAWFSSYSSGITRDMNISFLKGLQTIWKENALLSDTVNLDFTAIPFWGDDEPFENNWSGKRGKALASIQAVLAQDPESGILCYGDSTIRQQNQDDVVLTFLDFYHSDEHANHSNHSNHSLKYLVFDSKFTTYQNLDKLNRRNVKFITIRRRSPSLVKHIESIEASRWQKIDVKKSKGGIRTVAAYEEYDSLKDYEGLVRQVYIVSPGKIKPAILITNDFVIPLNQLIRKYARRWLVETEIAEQIDFFHLNRNCSGIVVKVDFDLTMTILAHNLLKLFGFNFDAYSHCGAETLFEKFIYAPGEVDIGQGKVNIAFKKKRLMPVLMEHLLNYDSLIVPWLNDFSLAFSVASSS